jgi:hydrogenase nickel incorporation protein HypA/HybF
MFAMLEERFDARELSGLTEIEVLAGEMSTVEPALLQSAFVAFTSTNPEYTHIKLTVNTVPLKIKCEICGQVSAVEHFVLTCPNGHRNTEIISGMELTIDKLHFEEEALASKEDELLN